MFSDDVNVILMDGASLTLNGVFGGTPINGGDSYDLTIWGQSSGTGKLEVSHTILKNNIIGAKNITINGGTVKGTGDEDGIGAKENLTINGGTVTGTGTGNQSCGIYIGRVLTINGGTVTGSGNGEGIVANENQTHSDSIKINGGTITAKANSTEEGIGIYGTNGITINGGNVTATGTGDCEEEVGTGMELNGDLNIYGGEVILMGGDFENKIPGLGLDSDRLKMKGGKITATGYSCGIRVNDNVNPLDTYDGEVIAIGNTAAIYATRSQYFNLYENPVIYVGDADPGSLFTGNNNELAYTDSDTCAYKYVNIIYKQDATLQTAPAASESDIFENTESALVSAGVTTGGTIYYQVTAADGTVVSDWSDEVPTAEKLSAGSYRVSYKIVGNKHYNDESDDSWYVDVNLKEQGTAYVSTDKMKDNYMSASIACTYEELKQSLLTDEDLQMIESGHDISVWITTTDISSSLTDNEIKTIKGLVPSEYIIGTIMDISCWKQILGSDATTVTTGSKTIEVSIKLPDNLNRRNRTFRILRIHNGVSTIIQATVDDNNILKFKTDRFSTYVLLYKDEVNNSSSDSATDTDNVSNPKTGDAGKMWLPIALAGICLVVSFSYELCYHRKIQNIH